jgi:hypothetical protein
MKYVVACASPFNGSVKVGTVDADSPEQAIFIAAERDGWDAGTVEDLEKFLSSIEDKYIATPVDQIRSYSESR